MPDIVYGTHLDMIRIHGLEDAETEVFQGVSMPLSGGSSPSAGVPAVTPGITPGVDDSVGGVVPSQQAAEKQATFDLGKVWSAQQRFAGTLISYLSKLDPGQNSDAESVVSDFINLLKSVNGLKSSTTAYDLSTKATMQLPLIWDTLSRQQPKELTKWIDDTETWGKSLETWWKDGLGALYAKDEAEDAIAAAQIALSDATTPEEAQAAQTALENAQTALANAQGMMTTAEGELPGGGGSPPTGLIELITIARALMTGNFVLVGIVLIRIAVPLAIDFLVKWIGGKLPGRKTPPTQAELQKIADAVEDVALKSAILKFGDNAMLDVKGNLLHY